MGILKLKITALMIVFCCSLSAQSVKIMMVLDKSGSIDFYNTPKPTVDKIISLVKYIQREGGRLAVSTLGVTSKQYLEEIKSGAQSERPRQERGQSAQQFREAMRKWMDASSPKLKDADIDRFVNSNKIKEIFDYSKLEPASDVNGALELAKIYFNDYDKEFGKSKRFLIIVSDGQNNRDVYNAPAAINCEILVVNRSEEVGVLENYKYKLFPSLEGAINYIIK